MWVNNLRAYYATYDGDPVKAVEDVSLHVKPGEVFGIAGESGCGKSTLASVMSLTAHPMLEIKSGTMGVDEYEIDPAQLSEVPRDWKGDLVALLPQRSLNSLNPTRRIRDVAFDVIHAHEPKVSKREAIARASLRLEQLGLPPRVLSAFPHQLSGGMRQRTVAVISTLLNPTVLIADEPSSALDVSSQRALVELLQELKLQGFIDRIVFITHDLALLSNIADRIAVMYAGEIVEVGETQSLINNPQHPYTQALLNSLLEPNLDVHKHRIEGIPGMPPDLRNPPPGCRFQPRCPYSMDICAVKAPPRVGTAEEYAACWLLVDDKQLKTEEHELTSLATA